MRGGTALRLRPESTYVKVEDRANQRRIRMKTNQRIYFAGCEDEECSVSSGHYHDDQFRSWRQSLTDAQREELGRTANKYQKSLSWVAANVGVAV